MVEKSSTLPTPPVTWLTSPSCTVWILRVSATVEIEMPTDAPSERSRFSRLDPSVRICGGRVANALMLSGMKTSPMPRP